MTASIWRKLFLASVVVLVVVAIVSLMIKAMMAIIPYLLLLSLVTFGLWWGSRALRRRFTPMGRR